MVAGPKLETLYDLFDTNDQTKWIDAANVSVTGGNLQLTTSATYQGRKSRLAGGYDLTNSYAATEMIQTSGDLTPSGTVDTAFNLWIDDNNYLSFVREGILLYCQRIVAGVATTIAQFTWSATTHRHVQFLHNGTTIAWQTSPDGTTWTTQGTPWTPSSFAITNLTVYFETGNYSGNTSGSATPALFASFNAASVPVAPVASVSMQSEASATALQLGWILNSGTNVRAVAATNSALTTGVVYGNTITRPTSGWCTSRVTGLTANTLYYTGVEVDGVIIATGRGQYRTLRTDLAASKVITSSCYATPGSQPVLSRIKTEDPAFFVQQGDIHYEDATTEAVWRAGFAASITAAGFASLLASVGMPYVWNNHDWGGDGSHASSPIATVVPAAYRQLSAGTVYPDSRGLWRTWAHAGVRHIVLDLYAHRSPETDANTSAKTMLGSTQKAWFLNLLQTSTEPAIIVYSGFAHRPDQTGGRWGSYPNERDEIGATIAAIPASQRKKIVFLGGDSHNICADDGTNAMWGRPSLNVSPMSATGNGPSAGTWNITNQLAESTRGYFSRLTFTPGTGSLAMTWDAVRDDGTVMATWSTSFPVPRLVDRWSGTALVRLRSDRWSGTALVEQVPTP